MNASEHHPARSADFLSRLHDGELDAAERARFEAHRAHCPECRDAASEFEEALAFFRSSRPRPPAPDLASRILRSLRASSPRRAPLGHAFGIDLKWAGAFATALIAVIIGSTVILERERRDARLLRETSIPVSVETRADALKPAAPKSQPSPAAEASNRVEAARVAEARRHSDVTAGLAASERKQLPAGREKTEASTEKRANAAPSDQALASAPAPQSAAPPPAAAAGAHAPPGSAARDEAAKPKVLDKSESEERAGALRARQRAELQGGEGGQQQQIASSTTTVAKEAAPTIRIQVFAPDGQGSAPEPSNAAELSLSATDRGEYVVVVRSDGTVASVREATSTSTGDARKVDKLQEVPRPALDELKKLRFAPAGRPRHLVLRVE